MKKLLPILLLLFTLQSFSKRPFGPSDVPVGKNIFYIELMGGGILPEMIFSGTPYDAYISDPALRRTGGIALRFQNSKVLSYSALISYREQGVTFPEKNETSLNANYLNLFIPVEFDLNFLSEKKKAGPAVVFFAGPYAAYYLGGNVKDLNYDFPLTKNEMNRWDIGVEAGVGIRIPTFSLQGRSNLNLKVSYYYGLNNSFPAVFPDYNNEQLEQLLLSGTGSRINRGLRLTISYEISLNRQKMNTFTAGGDGKKTYKRFLIF